MLIDTHCHLADPAYDADRAAGAGPGLGRRGRPRRGDRRVPGPRRARARAGRGRAPALGHRRRPPPRRARTGARRPSLAPRACCGIRGWWPWARWASTSTTIIRPAPPSARPSRPSSRSPRRPGKPAVIHAREADDDVAAILREPSRASPPSCIPSAAARRSCERGWFTATMCRSAEWSPSRTGAWTRRSARRRWIGCCSRPTARIWRRFRIAASATSRRSWPAAWRERHRAVAELMRRQNASEVSIVRSKYEGEAARARLGLHSYLLASRASPGEQPSRPTSPSRRPPSSGPSPRWPPRWASAPTRSFPTGTTRPRSAPRRSRAASRRAGWCWSPASTPRRRAKARAR